MEASKWIDLSHVIKDGGTAYPGDDNLLLVQKATIASDGFTNFSMTTSMHFGTHIDSPLHFVSNSPFISEYNIENFQGLACVVDCTGLGVIEKSVLPADLDLYDVVLFYTGHDSKWGNEDYFTNHPLMSEEVAEELIHNNIRIVGMDIPTPDREPFLIHEILLRNGCFIVENLNNLKLLLNEKVVRFCAFPLRIEADSSPVRAVAMINY